MSASLQRKSDLLPMHYNPDMLNMLELSSLFNQV